MATAVVIPYSPRHAFVPFHDTQRRWSVVIAHRVWFDRLEFCGCGNPEIVLEHLRKAMRALKDQSEERRGQRPSVHAWTAEDEARLEATRQAIGGGEKGYGPLYYMTAYFLDAAGLTEHGGSVPGWLTDDGEELLAFLEGRPEEQWLALADAVDGETA